MAGSFYGGSCPYSSRVTEVGIMEGISGFSPITAIVTGSDSGIGRATAVAMAKSGLDVGITWHSDQDGAERTAAEELGGLDVFINKAGTGDGTKFLDLDIETWTKTLDANLKGAFVCLQAAARRVVQAGTGGRIVFVTSVHEFQPRIGAAAFDASKHALGG
jgi:NAD(P)-dependent dehydrogenase (short-subunit alcohol dehydrogenase family)